MQTQYPDLAAPFESRYPVLTPHIAHAVPVQGVEQTSRVQGVLCCGGVVGQPAESAVGTLKQE